MKELIQRKAEIEANFKAAEQKSKDGHMALGRSASHALFVMKV
jgi:hypothetical protein